MKIPITQDTLRRLSPSADVWDTKLPGFVVRVHRSGRASYVVSLGRGRWYTLGPVSHLKLKDAREAAQAILGDVARGKDPVGEKRASRSMTFKTYLQEVYAPWLLDHRKTGVEIAKRLQRHFVPVLGSTTLGDISGFTIEKWRSKRLKAGKAPGTVDRDISDLRGALTKAVEWGKLSAHPLAKVKNIKKSDNMRVRYLSADEETRLRDALVARDEARRTDRDSANAWRQERGYPGFPDHGRYTDILTPLVLMALQTGCRFGELANLEWADVNLMRGLITLRGTGTKSGRTRHIPLNTEARDVLASWQASFTASGYVFPGRDGARLVTIKTAWTNLLKVAGITGFRFHDTRHDFASKLVMAGVDLNTVRELLGHGDIKMVLRYAHLAPDHLAAAVEKLG